MVDLNNYDFGFLNINNYIIPEEYLLSSYAEFSFEFENLCSASRQAHKIRENK